MLTAGAVPEAVGAVRGAEVPDITAEHGASVVVFDAAGPAPVQVTPEAVRKALARPPVPGVAAGGFEVTAAHDPFAAALVERLRPVVAGTRAEAWVFDRRTEQSPVLTVGLFRSGEALRAAVDAAARAALPVGALADVALLDAATRRGLRRALPGARVVPLT